MHLARFEAYCLLSSCLDKELTHAMMCMTLRGMVKAMYLSLYLGVDAFSLPFDFNPLHI